MFRTQQNAFDDVVAKATDENLTSENWELIIDVCDKVQGNESGSKDVVAAMIKRLAHRNANVQLYTLELANALSQNCGIPMHRELASRSFTDSLLRLAGDRTTHQQVKAKILERMEEWSKMFSNNLELGIMEQAFKRLKSQSKFLAFSVGYRTDLGSTDPNLQPPQAPVKKQITQYDRLKEEEELQMALKLSIQDSKSQAPSKPAELSGQPSATGASSSQTAVTTPQPVPSGTTAATVSRVRALYDFVPSEPGELQFRKGDVIAVLESVYKDWWKGSLRGQTGIFPLNYVEKLSDPTQEELQKEAQVEAEVFGKIKHVERLLSLLSTNTGDVNPRDEDEITELYHDTLAVRPKLIELIARYTQKKDDFQQLNEKFIKARRDYEALLESSMAHSAQQYSRPGAQPYAYGTGPAGYPPQQPPQQQQRYYAHESQPPNAAVPPPQFQTQGPQGFQPPYPSSTPVPQKTAPQQGYPPNFQPPRRQSYHSDAPSQHPPSQPQEMATSVYDTPTDSQSQRQPSYPPNQPPESKDYYASSVYSQESHYPSQPSEHPPAASNPYPPSQPQALQHQHSGFATSHPPSYPPQQPSHPPPGLPPERQSTVSPYETFVPPPNPSGGIPLPQQQPQQQYQAYQPPQAAGAGAPANYYR